MENQEKFVLVIEDNGDLRTLFSQVLKMGGYRAVTVPNGAEAVEYVREHGTPSLTFLDLTMPFMGGAECLEKLRDFPGFDDGAVVLTSGREDLMDRAESLHVQGYLKKPVELKKILETAKTWMH